jgi:hypothetical protein
MREKLSYANVMATIAVFGVIAGGTAVALPDRDSGPRERPVTFKQLNMLNGCEVFSETLFRPSAGKDSSGIVHLRGVMYGCDPDETLFRLKPKLRPKKSTWSVVVVNGGLGAVYVNPDGTGHFTNVAAATNGDPTESIFLDGITFPAR